MFKKKYLFLRYKATQTKTKDKKHIYKQATIKNNKIYKYLLLLQPYYKNHTNNYLMF